MGGGGGELARVRPTARTGPACLRENCHSLCVRHPAPVVIVDVTARPVLVVVRATPLCDGFRWGWTVAAIFESHVVVPCGVDLLRPAADVVLA